MSDEARLCAELADLRAAVSAEMDARTVGVVHAAPGYAEGYVLLSVATATYLLDADGRVAHAWPSARSVFSAYLLESGDLIRDGNDMPLAPQFRAGGAAGYVERVTWDNRVVWTWSALPRFRYLSHHDLEPLPSGNVLVLVWEKKTKGEAVAAGRHPDLCPDGEVWNNLVVEVGAAAAPSRTAAEVWRWDQWAHLCQDYDASRPNYVEDVGARPDLLDVNYCPPGGKARCRNGGLKGGDHTATGHAVFDSAAGQTGERDWLHANAVSFARGAGLVCVSYNVPCEIVLFKHRGDGGLVYRFGNPLVARSGDRFAQELFVQHSATVVSSEAGTVNVLLFNNGRMPDRPWSAVEEYAIDVDGQTHAKVWSHGPAAGRAGSFYCHHSSGVRRLANGNTLITMGPQGILVEVDPAGTEVWRYVNPIQNHGGDAPYAIMKQGAQRGAGRFGLFVCDKYDAARVPRLRDLAPGAGSRLEDGPV